MEVRALILLLLVGLLVIAPIGSGQCGTKPRFASRNGRLYANDQPFEMKGTNWFGFETEVFGPHGCWTFGSPQECFDWNFNFLRSNRFNALRLPLAVDVIYNNPSANDWPFNGAKSLDIVNQLIDTAGKYGIMIMLDVHRVRHDLGISELWYDTDWPTSKVKTALSVLMNRFNSKWNVFAIDLKNEPHGRAAWGNNDPSTDWRLAAEDFANYIIGNNSDWLIFVEGVETNAVGQSNTYGCYWGENLMGVRQNPVRVSQPERLVYSPHAYGPGVFRQPYHDAPNFPANLNAIWEEHFGFVKDLTGRAVVIGEWGGRCEGDDQRYHDQLSSYLQSKGMQSNFYWCLNPNSGDTGGLLEDDWRTPVQRKLTVLANTVPNPTVFC